MAYRDSLEALRTRHAMLERTLAEIRTRSRELSALAAEESRVLKELEETRAHLQNAAPGRALPMLDAVRVASPCSASWADMIGDEPVRFCGGCAKNVYNLSAMTSEEAEHLLRREGDLCVRLHRRADGMVMTADCPVGAKRKRVRRAAAGIVGGGVMAAAAALGVDAASPLTGVRVASTHAVPSVAPPVESGGREGMPSPRGDFVTMGLRAPDRPAKPAKRECQCQAGDPLCACY